MTQLRLMFVVCLAAGCAENRTAAFVGGWAYQQGSAVSVRCPDRPPSTFPLASAPVTLAAVEEAAISASDPTGCVLRYRSRAGGPRSPTASAAPRPPGPSPSSAARSTSRPMASAWPSPWLARSLRPPAPRPARRPSTGP